MFKFTSEPELNEYIGFKVEKNWYCVNIHNVQEIILIPPISKIPNVPDYVEGAINLRGKIIQVVNMRKWFQLSWEPFTKDSRIIIMVIEDNLLGLLVDFVDEVFRADDFIQNSIPEIISKKLNRKFLNSIILQEDRIVLDINPEKIHIQEVKA